MGKYVGTYMENTPIIMMKCDEPWTSFLRQPFFERTPTMLYPVRIGIGQKLRVSGTKITGYATAGRTKGLQETHNLSYALRLSNVFIYTSDNTSMIHLRIRVLFRKHILLFVPWCSFLVGALLIFHNWGWPISTSLFAGHLSLSDPWEVANVVQFFAPKHLAGRHLLTRQYVTSPGTCRACLPEATRWCDWGHGHADGCKGGKYPHGYNMVQL